MKNKSAFTVIELIVAIAIFLILVAMLLPAIQRASQKAKVINEKQHQEQVHPRETFNVGDMVYIDGLDITGRVNEIWPVLGGNPTADILVRSTNGVQHLEKINTFLLKKVPQAAESWR